MRLVRNLTAALTMAGLGALAPGCVKPPEAIRGPVLPFIEDDYGRALAEARSKKLPMFVESWAPW